MSKLATRFRFLCWRPGRMSAMAAVCFLTVMSTPVAAEDGPRFDVLFNGKDLTGWSGLEQFWSVQDGAIVGETTAENPTSGNTFLIWQGGDVGDFEFRCKVRFSGNNSGVQYRSRVVDEAGFALAGYQADLHPKPDYFGMMYGEKTGRGIIATRGQRVVIGEDEKSTVVGKVGNGETLVDSDWNDLRIVAVGNRMIHQVNGITTVDVTDNHPAGSRSGRLGLQLHAGAAMKVEFRSLLLRSLAGDEADRTLESAVNAAAPEVASAKAERTHDWLTNAPAANWIWTKRAFNDQKVALRKTFELPGDIKSAQLYVSCDNGHTCFVNGREVAKSSEWQRATEKDIAKSLVPGTNVIAVEGSNQGGTGGFVFKLVVKSAAGETSVASDASWMITEANESAPAEGWKQPDFDESGWSPVHVIGKIGREPWGIPNYGKDPGSNPNVDALAAKNILAPPGFTVERIYRIPKAEGSWVSLTSDPQGRLYACDQGDKGLYRLTLSATEPAIVEKVSVGPLKSLRGAQGLLWAFDSLWFHQNGGHLYRLTDSDGDDRLDTMEQVPSATGGGEHGNHAVIVTEDGAELYLDGGNAAPIGETSASRVPTWYEGQLLPRMWDSNGHAQGRMAPGGWVTRLNPETYEQTIYAIGFRNQYDIALNRFGDLFTYDADMEWDLGAPWYRPTRICHVVSGADFGWRSGSGKWPAYYEDSLPPTVDIGPGSPTGVVSGLGTSFPTRYQDAIFALDWTFGTIYAIHLTPNGASYEGVAEPFVTGSPLPLTDATVLPDGSLVFGVGGRGTDSALYRIRYVGRESTAEPTEVDEAAAEARAARRSLEAYHGVEDAAAVEAAWPYLSSSDRFLRYAARIAVESQPVGSWVERAFVEKEPQAAIAAAVAVARHGGSDHAEQVLANLLKLEFGALDIGQQLGLLRAYALVFDRLSKPSEASREQVIAQLSPSFPSANNDVNTELVRVLTSLRETSVISKTLALIEGRDAPTLPNWSELASRNSRYGGAVNRMLANHPPTHELHYAFMLRHLRDGWTLEQRRTYFTFLNEAAKAAGGSSYSGYLSRIRAEALATCTDAEREALEDITGEDFDPKPDFEIVKPQGPGREWTVDEAVRIGSRGKASFERGRALYFGATCASCHRLAGLGGAIGPDLTSIPNKFDTRYMVEAIVYPSKHISDQYGASNVLLADGRFVTGLVVPKGDGKLTIYPNKVGADPIEVTEDDIEDIAESPVSQMPEKLLNGMSESELRDLVTYLMSGGNPEHKRYSK